MNGVEAGIIEMLESIDTDADQPLNGCATRFSVINAIRYFAAVAAIFSKSLRATCT